MDSINHEESKPKRKLSEDIGYVLYSALGSFYIPSCIMVFVYIRIYFAAKRRARRGIKKIPRKQASDQKVTSFTVPSGKGGTTPMPSVPSASTSKQQQIATIEMVPSGKNQRTIPIPVVTCDLASDMSSEACDGDNGNGVQDTLKVSTIAGTHSTMTIRSSNGTTSAGGQNNELQIGGNASSVHNRNRALSVGIDNDMVSEFDPSSSDSGVVSRCAVVKPLKFKLCQPIFGKKHQQKKREAKQLKQQQEQQKQAAQQMNQIHQNLQQTVDTTEIEPVIPKVQKPRDPEKEKRRIARKKEKRATLILGLIMGSFIASWLPFFFLYILKPACKFCVIPESAFAVAFWLGYMNSALNPAIYTIFNKDFRRAFRRILFK